MDLFKKINEDAKPDHVKKERKYFGECVEHLTSLVEFADKEKANAVDSRKSDYESIARKARVLSNELQKHLDSYK